MVERYLELALRLLPLVVELVRELERLLPRAKTGPVKRALVTGAVEAAFRSRPELASEVCTAQAQDLVGWLVDQAVSALHAGGVLTHPPTP